MKTRTAAMPAIPSPHWHSLGAALGILAATLLGWNFVLAVGTDIGLGIVVGSILDMQRGGSSSG